MRIFDIAYSDRDVEKYLQTGDFENWFKIYEDRDGNYCYNFNTTLYFEGLDKNSLFEYVCVNDTQWPLISYKIYGTTRFAWALMKINNVQAKDVFKILRSGDKILYISKEFMEKVVDTITDDTES